VFSHFFIERPIFAAVLSIVITLAGGVAYINLPVAQYPAITPPSIMVMCNYPGANCHAVADSVAAPIEQQINGVENMIYMVSQSNNDGSYQLTVTFKPGVNLNFAQVLVQNRINLALPLLPDVVKQAGVTTRKRNPDILQVIAIYSPKGRYGQVYLSNYALLQIKDELARVEGVGDVGLFGGQDYSMRLWVDPEKLASMNMTASDVANAVREQNMQVAAGHFGQQPTPDRTPFEFTIETLGRLKTPEQFENIVLRSDGAGRKILLKDVGRAELGAKSLDTTSKVNIVVNDEVYFRPNASVAVWALPDANAIATADRVIKKMEELKKSFPEDIDYIVSLDMTPFIKESIKEVFRTLIEAIALVAIVVLVFLQNWRSAIIPLVAVPVAIVGTFAVMIAIGFSLNNLTLFGLVLAIGIVVDDAIVVVEAVEHHIEEGMSPRQAAHLAMDQVSGPVVAVALVLSAVFVPCAFITGITGEFFRQFALTIAASTILSAFNSLTLSPALAAILLQRRGAKRDIPGRLLHFLLGWFFRLFNWSFRRATGVYTRVVGLALRGSVIVLVVYGGLILLTWWTARQLPSGYIPNQDQARFYIAVQLPDAASLERTQAVMDHIARVVRSVKGTKDITEIAGQSFTFNANGSNFGNFFVTFDEFDKRKDPSMAADAICQRVRERLEEEVPEAKIAIFTPPPISGLGSASGFKIIIEDRSDLGFEEIQKQVDRVMAAGNAGHFRLSARSLAALRAQPEPDLAQLDALTQKEFSSAKAFHKALGEALGKAGIHNLTEVAKIQERVAPTGSGKKLTLNEKSLAQLRKMAERSLDFLKPVPEVVVAKLESLLDREFLTRESFDAALADPLKKGLEEANVHDKAERTRIENRVFADAENRKVVGNLFSVFRAATPQLYVDLDRDQCQAMGVDPKEVFNTLQIYLGSLYVNDFNLFGRTWQVVVQAHGEFRTDPNKVKLLKVRNREGGMVPLGALLNIREVGRPINIGRYNMYPAAAILGLTKEGVSTGQGIEEMEALCAEILPPGMAFEWTEINYMQIDASKNIWNNLIFPLAVMFVFLVLAAQYESWSLPLAVILVVPMCILGSLAGVAATRLDILAQWALKVGVVVTPSDINIFTQIGFVVLVGLASKNAILIVEFAKHKREDDGMSRTEATLAACRLRLRPILMTSFAFILGVVPLLLGHGAGAEMRRVLGVAVFSGMLGVTIFGIFLTPVFFYVIEGFAEIPLFSTARARQVGRGLSYAVGVATLGLPWLLPLLLRRTGVRHALGNKEEEAIADRRPEDNGQAAAPEGGDKEIRSDPASETLAGPTLVSATGDRVVPLDGNGNGASSPSVDYVVPIDGDGNGVGPVVNSAGHAGKIGALSHGNGEGVGQDSHPAGEGGAVSVLPSGNGNGNGNGKHEGNVDADPDALKTCK
jgi:hydrophobe/amphiphile efflux-1 (HAE1) family protein